VIATSTTRRLCREAPRHASPEVNDNGGAHVHGAVDDHVCVNVEVGVEVDVYVYVEVAALLASARWAP